MKIHQFHPFAAPYDAITSHLFFVQKVLSGVGVEGKIFALENKGVEGVEPWNPQELGPKDILLVHHSQGHAGIEKLREISNPIYLMYHNITPEKWIPHDLFLRHLSKMGRIQLQWLCGISEKIFAASHYSGEEIRKCGFACEVLPLLEMDQMHYLERRSASPLLIFVGRLVPHKNQAFLIEALANLSTSYELHLVGKEDRLYGYYLRKLAGVTGRKVVFYEKLSSSRLLQLYQNAGAFVCSSLHEGYGIPLVEAMAARVPIFYLPNAAVPEVMGGAGVGIQTENPAEFATAVTEGLKFRDRILDLQEERIQSLRSEQNRGRILECLL